MKHFTKSLLVLFAALFSFSVAFAETGTETEKDQKNGNKDVTAEGQSYTIAGTYIAGTGSSMAEPMTSKGLKFRTGQAGGSLEFTVRENYTITKLYVAAVGNYAKKDASIDQFINVTKVEVDGSEVTFDGGAFPEKGASEAGELTVSGIAAKEKIVLYFDNSNAGGTQINAAWSVDWERPDATQPTITVTPESVNLVPGATYKLNVHVDPNTFTTQWVSSDESVATVDEEGNVTAVAPGTATISNQWADDATVQGAAVINVANFDASAYTATTLDFTAMGDVTLTLESTAVGAIWNEANKKANNVFFCTNEGLQNIAVQAVLDSKNKGWSIVDGEGLVLGSGAGRCAAVGNLKSGEIVEIFYTGSAFYTGSKDDAVRKDDGAPKTALNEGVGRAIYKMDAAGLLGFEIEKGKAITKIVVYTNALIDAKAALEEAISKLKALGVAPLASIIAEAEAALNADDATVASIAAAAKKLDTDVKDFAKKTLSKAVVLAQQLNTEAANAAATAGMTVYMNPSSTTEDYINALFDILNAVQPLIDEYAPQVKEFADRYGYPELKAAFEAVIAAINDKDVDKAIAGAMTMLTQLKSAANDVKTRMEPYLEVLDSESLNTSIENITTLLNSGSNDFAAIVDAVKAAVRQFLVASSTFVGKVEAAVAAGADDSDLKAALDNAKAVLADPNSSIVAIGTAIQELVKAYKSFTTGVDTINVAEKKDDVVFDLQGRRVMSDRKGLYIINGKKVIIK